MAEDPAAPGARQALERGRARLTGARSRLQRTVERIEAILGESGELDPRERELLETARSRLRDASDLDSAFAAVEEFIAAEERKQRRRERQQRERRRQERQQQQQSGPGAPEPAQPAPDADPPDADPPDADERDDAPENRQPDEGDGDRTPPRGGGGETCQIPPGGCSNLPQPPDCECILD